MPQLEEPSRINPVNYPTEIGEDNSSVHEAQSAINYVGQTAVEAEIEYKIGDNVIFQTRDADNPELEGRIVRRVNSDEFDDLHYVLPTSPVTGRFKLEVQSVGEENMRPLNR